MSDFGAFLLVFAVIIFLVGLIKALSWLTLVQERGGFRAVARQSFDTYVERRPVRKSESKESGDEPPRSHAIPLLNGAEPRSPVLEPNAELQLNAIEVAAIQRMIEHNKTAAKPSKSSTIHAGFSVSRGGSPTYQRASLIYDMLFGPPSPVFPPLTPEQRDLRKELRLPVRQNT